MNKLTAEMYAVVNNTARKIGIQAYAEKEAPELEGAVGFRSKCTSTPKDPEAQNKPKSQRS